MFATNYTKSFNERIRSSIFSLLSRLHQSDNLLLLITSTPIFILRAVCTHTGGHYYTHNICIVFLLIKLFIFDFDFYNLFN